MIGKAREREEKVKKSDYIENVVKKREEKAAEKRKERERKAKKERLKKGGKKQ